MNFIFKTTAFTQVHIFGRADHHDDALEKHFKRNYVNRHISNTDVESGSFAAF
jgi:uncharacterized protein YfeS